MLQKHSTTRQDFGNDWNISTPVNNSAADQERLALLLPLGNQVTMAPLPVDMCFPYCYRFSLAGSQAGCDCIRAGSQGSSALKLVATQSEPHSASNQLSCPMWTSAMERRGTRETRGILKLDVRIRPSEVDGTTSCRMDVPFRQTRRAREKEKIPRDGEDVRHSADRIGGSTPPKCPPLD
jgi:hypothetical protein